MTKKNNTPLIIVIDKREQLPWRFIGHSASLVFTTLETGDYSLYGFQKHGVSIERKSQNDLFSSIGKGHRIFMDRMKRMAEFECKALVIESTYDRLLHPHRNFSKVHPSSIIGSLSKTASVYGVPVILAGGRRNAQDFVYRMLWHYRESKYHVQVAVDSKLKRTFKPIDFSSKTL